jgi:hypothetical protein
LLYTGEKMMERKVALKLLKDLNMAIRKEEISEKDFFAILNNYMGVEK